MQHKTATLPLLEGCTAARGRHARAWERGGKLFAEFDAHGRTLVLAAGGAVTINMAYDPKTGKFCETQVEQLKRVFRAAGPIH